MTSESRRNLAAVMFVDMVGYTALMATDEEAARAQTARQRRVVGAQTERFGGTVKQYFGDGTLALFTSAVQAAHCAVAIQMALRRPPEVLVRIGVHACDIIDEGDGIFGAGIEIAQHVESLAAPGGVLVSDKVWDEIKNHRDLETVAMGAVDIEDVSGPVRVFAVTNDGLPVRSLDARAPASKRALGDAHAAEHHGVARIPESGAPVPIGSGREDRARGPWILGKSRATRVALFIAVLVLGGITYSWLVRPAGLRSYGANIGAQRGTPSIAVLPFRSLSSDSAATSFFADGMHDDIMTQLAKLRSIAVTARTSVMQYAGTEKPIQVIGRELGVGAILEGGVQRSGDAIRLTAQLIDATNGENLWANTYDRELSAANVFAIQTELAEAITQELRIVLTGDERRALEAVPTASLAAYDAYLRGGAALRRDVGPEDLEAAERAFQEAVALDPTFAAAYARLAVTHLNTYWNAWDRTDERLALATAALERAEAIDPANPEVLVARGYYHYWGFREYAAAQAAFSAAQNALPGDARLHEARAYVFRRVGDWDQAIHEFEIAVDLDPLNGELIRALGQTHLYVGDYDIAERLLDRALTVDPGRWSALFDRALVDALRTGDVTRLRQMAAAADDNPALLYVRWLIAYADGDDSTAFAMASQVDDPLEQQTAVHPRALLNALMHRRQGRAARATAAADSARASLEAMVAAKPEDPRLRSALGTAYALLGRRADAVENGMDAVRAMPVERDALDGPEYLLHLARIYVLLGNQDDAIATLERLLSVPTGNSLNTILFEPPFAGLRGHPGLSGIEQKLGGR